MQRPLRDWRSAKAGQTSASRLTRLSWHRRATAVNSPDGAGGSGGLARPARSALAGGLHAPGTAGISHEATQTGTKVRLAVLPDGAAFRLAKQNRRRATGTGWKSAGAGDSPPLTPTRIAMVRVASGGPPDACRRPGTGGCLTGCLLVHQATRTPVAGVAGGALLVRAEGRQGPEEGATVHVRGRWCRRETCRPGIWRRA